MHPSWLRVRSPRRFTGLFAAAVFAAVLAAPVASLAAGPAPAAPVTEKRPAPATFFGTTAADDYRWLEDWSSPATKAWVDAQNALTRGVLDSLPSRGAILDRVTALTRDVAARYGGLVSRGGVIFALKDQPPLNQPLLVALRSLDDTSTERVLVDPNALDPSGATTIDFFVPSVDGTRVAVSMSRGGTESGDVHLFDTRTGRELPDVLPHVNDGTAGGSVAWTPDDSGLWYTRYPDAGARPAGEMHFWQQAWFHKLGTPRDSDTCLLGNGLPKIAELEFSTSDAGRWLLVAVKNGDGGQVGWMLRGPTGEMQRVARFDEGLEDAKFGPDALLMLVRGANPNGSVLRAPLAHAALAKAREIVAAGDTAIDGIDVAGDRLYVRDILGGPNDVRVFTLEGRALPSLPIPPMSSVGGLAPLGGGAFAIELESYTEPARWLRWDPAKGALRPTALQMKSPADYSDVEVRREFAVSRDGTRVPVSVLVKKGVALDGSAPLLLYGYGGYGISQRPGFSPSRLLWIEQGGIYAIAGLRGGREYGEAWHRAGMLTRKQNVFDDFAACAQALVDRRYTSRDRLAIMGGSNGGLLMGAALTQHPELYRAVVSEVGIYDMLRVELSPNGLFNTTEYGSVKDSAQFRALLGYSPFHNVHDGTRYPATLLLTGVNDPRVEPYHSFKFAARLQASGTTRPVLLRTSMTTGHVGTPLNARNEEYADVFSFLFSQLGLAYKPVPVRVP